MAPTTNTKTRWADEADDEDDLLLDSLPPTSTLKTLSDGTIQIPPTHTSRVDSKGIKVITSYRSNPSNPTSLFKTITKVKVNRVQVLEHVDVAKRREWKKFGQAAGDADQSNVTIQSKDDIYMEDPHADTDLQDEDVSKALAGNLNAFWAKQQRRQLERKYDVEGYVDEQDPTSLDPSSNASDGWQKVGGGAGSSTTGDKSTQKYVPPGAKAAGKSSGSGSLAALASRSGSGPSDSKSNDRDQNTIRVTNISEDTTESELQALFAPYGRISRVYLAKDKETLQSRGFAFVSFVHREDAARAMEALQGFGYDHLILKLEWARPSAPKDPGSEGTQYRSGYGKALAQDTKDKVSYASNLTK